MESPEVTKEDTVEKDSTEFITGYVHGFVDARQRLETPYRFHC